MSRSESRSGPGLRAVLGVALLGVVAASAGCVETSIREGREPMDYEPAEVPPSEPTSPGSIWSGSTQGSSFMFFDAKARRVGDLVTVVIIEQTQAEGNAQTKTKSDRKVNGSIASDVGFQSFIASPIKGLMKVMGLEHAGTSVAEGQPLNVIESGMKNEFDGQGNTSRRGKFTGVIACRVIGVLPNGILHIKGRRSVVVNHEAQYISLEGLVRREDLTIENQVLSNSVAEMRLAYDGLGVLDDKQRPGWMTRVLDWIYPF